MSVSYAGIGSRKSPAEVCSLATSLACWLADEGFELRSGHADGFDLAVEKGCDLVKGPKSIYLPKRRFNGSASQLFEVSEKALELASKYHPNWNAVKPWHRPLLARNGYQVLGPNLDSSTKSKFIVCWTKNGKLVGGTAQALRIAADPQYNIPIYNIGSFKKLPSLAEMQAAISKFF